MNKNELPISEKFYSLQCEGVTNGYPAYFVRLKGCNLLCGNPNLRNVQDKTNQDEIERNADKNATWVCDTISVWLKGKQTSYNSVIQDWKQEGELPYIESGITHVIWTGGEPTVHDKRIVDFIDYFKTEFPQSTPYYEIETNGTKMLSNDLYSRLHQINCSPKLQNSAMSINRRINGSALEQIASHPNSWFKFVVSSEADLEEAKQTMIKPYNLPQERIILMPGLSDQKNFHERTRFCYELAKKNHYIGISRGHISAWDKTTGV